MKKISILILATLFIILIGCKKEDPLPLCVIEDFGWVLVENETTYDGWVDATEYGQEENYEAFLHHGESYDYGKMNSGTITIWFTFDGDEWFYEYENLSHCEDLTFTWLPELKKSSKNIPVLKFTKDGQTSYLIPSKK